MKASAKPSKQLRNSRHQRLIEAQAASGRKWSKSMVQALMNHMDRMNRKEVALGPAG